VTEAPDAILYPGIEPGFILVVYKSIQQLHIYRHDGQGGLFLVKILPCSTGMAHGDKLIRGDKKTPEGYYIFRQKLLPTELPDIYGIMAFPMDYPNFWDRTVGRGGDGIWTHGVNKPLVDYDSEGCIELLNHDLAELEPYISLFDTPILVYDEPKTADVTVLAAEGRKVLDFVESWRLAWTTKNQAEYAAKYDLEFVNSDGLSHQGWMEKKRRLAQGYQRIEVELDDLRVFRHRETIVVTFGQSYRGDNRFSSAGLKRLYLKEDGNGGYLILAEEFLNSPGPQPEKWLTAAERAWALTTPPLAVAQVATPAAAASAGVLLPAQPTLVAEATPATSPDEDAALAAAEETARAALESRSAGSAGEAPALADLSPQVRPAAPETASAPAPAVVTAAPSPDPEPEPVSVPEPTASTPPELAPEPTEAAASVEPRPQAAGSVETVATVAALTPGSAGAPAASSDASPAAPGASPTPAPKAGLDAQAAVTLLDQWARAWEDRDQAAYFAFYAPDFHFPERGLDLPAFRRYRGGHINRAAFVSVDLADVEVSVQGARATVIFTQTYESDRTSDRGRKTLELIEVDGRWRILKETFQPLS
jgi:murein L,D-transpeptidase YafK